jgi:hypothetical protein
MAGVRVSSGEVAAGVIELTLTGEYPFLEIINSGTAAVGVVAQTGSAPADPALGGDDVDMVPAGRSLVIPVAGQQFDPAQGGTDPGTFIKVVAAGATGMVTARAAMGVNG